MNTFKKQDPPIYKSIKWGMCFLLSSFLTACSLSTDSNENESLSEAIKDFSIETDQDVYLVDEDDPLVITYAYVNEGNQTFYPGSCLGVPSDNLEKLVDGEWVPAYSPFCARPLGPPIKVESGEQYEATIQLSPSTWDSALKNASWYGGEIEGIYRVHEKVYGEWSIKKFDNGILQSKAVVSNEFEIRKSS